MEVICWVIPLIFHRGLAPRVWGTQLWRRWADCISDDKFSLITHKYYALFHSLHKCSPEAALESLTNHWALPYISLHNCSKRTWKLSLDYSTHPTLLSSYGTSLSARIPHSHLKVFRIILPSGGGTPVNCWGAVLCASSVEQHKSAPGCSIIRSSLAKADNCNNNIQPLIEYFSTFHQQTLKKVT